MLQSRIREIRKSKKLTLAQVGEKAGTTAQTIGRLETGMRTLSITWVNRIAAALEVDPSELLVMPENGDVPVSGYLQANAEVLKKDAGTIGFRLKADHPVAIRVAENIDGIYLADDTIICDLLPVEQWHTALGSNCLIEDNNGKQVFARLLSAQSDKVSYLPLQSGATITESKDVINLAKAVLLVRPLD